MWGIPVQSLKTFTSQRMATPPSGQGWVHINKMCSLISSSSIPAFTFCCYIFIRCHVAVFLSLGDSLPPLIVFKQTPRAWIQRQKHLRESYSSLLLQMTNHTQRWPRDFLTDKVISMVSPRYLDSFFSMTSISSAGSPTSAFLYTYIAGGV